NFVSEAQLWLGKAQIKLKDYLAAEKTLQNVLNSKLKREIRDESQFLLGDLYYEQENYEAAAREFEVTSNKAKNKKLRLQATLQMGECYFKLKKYSQAAASFQKARKLSADKETEFQALFKLALCQKLLGQYDEAIQIYTNLLRTEYHQAEWPKVKLELADCLFRKEHPEEAMEWYQSIIQDHPKTEASAQALFHIGRIFETVYANYDSAKEYYDQVQPEYSRSAIVPEAEAKSKDIGTLLGLRLTIRKQQFPGTLKERASEQEKQSDENPAPQDSSFFLSQTSDTLLFPFPDQGKRDTTKAAPKKTRQSKPLPTFDKNDIIKNMLLLAELYLFQFSQPDSALVYYKKVLNQAPDSSYASLAPHVLYSIAYVLREIKEDSLAADSLYRELVEKYPDSPQAKKARQLLGLPMITNYGDGAAALFRKAEQDFFDKGEIKQALDKYKQVAEKFPQSEYAPKSLYAVGWLYEKLKSNKEASKTYQKLVEKYPNSEYAKQVKRKLDQVNQSSDITDKKEAEEVETQDQTTVVRPPTATATETSVPPKLESQKKTMGDTLKAAIKDSLKPEVPKFGHTITDVVKKLDKMDKRLELLEAKVERMDRRFNENFESITQQLENVDQRFKSVEQRVEDLNRTMFWRFGTFVLLYTLILGILYKTVINKRKSPSKEKPDL
ncbi:MAG: tetratricopeptide repeat protein, partial [candidate division KSB1 bacterium]|nr:tetratricopeptide repeat protein [candidate division KSB1 bacterium]